MRRGAMIVALAATCFGVVATSAAEVTQRNGVRVSFGGEMSPRRLPREGTGPVAVEVSARIVPVGDQARPPRLRRISVAINRYGRIDGTGLPVCRVTDIQPSTSAKAMQACGPSLVGSGGFRARVLLPEQSPFPSAGKILAFHGVHEGEPAILAHVYGTSPAPTSFTLPFVIGRAGGTFGTELSARLPEVTSEWGYVTGLDLNLRRRYRWGGKARSYVVAGCPAPRGLGGAVFPFVKARFGFKGFEIGSTVIRRCTARG
jgi:hypothetical protein